MLDKLFLRCTQLPFLKKWLWRAWYGYLARRYRKADWTFMNYGYHDPTLPRLALEAADEPERYCIQLYHHVVESIPMRGLNVLEVGSGRGGGASFVSRYLKPAHLTGVDLSEQAVGFCRETHRL